MIRTGSFLAFLCLVMLAGRLSAQDPLQKMRSEEIITIDEKEYWLHTVKRGQTLYMISKAYGVEVQDIITENPEVKEGLDSGMKLKIPRTPEPGMTPEEDGLTQPVIIQLPPQDSLVLTETPCGKDLEGMKQVYSIALMLPLYLGEVVSIDPETQAEDVENLRPLQFLPFYEGFMMAMDSLKKTGHKLKITVYDVDKDTIKTRRLLRNPELKNTDLIIGLVYNKNFQMVADFAMKNGISIVNPISERDQIVTNNQFVLKIRPSLKSQAENLFSFTQGRFPGANVILIRNKTERIGNLPDSVLIRMNAIVVSGHQDAIQHMKRDRDNLIILFSDNKSFILDVVTKINEVRAEYPVILFGLPRWDGIDGIEPDYLVNLRAHVMVPFFINYDDPEVKKFVRNYQEKYKTDPDPLAFQGFDVAFFFSSALKMYGKNFRNCITNLRMNSLQTNFRMIRRSPRNGLENSFWEIYMYDNYRLVPIIH